MKMPEASPHKINHPSAWKSADIEGDTSWIWSFTEAELAELDAALRYSKARGLAEQDVTKADFPLPILSVKLDQLLSELEQGRGLILLRGFPVERYEEADIRRMYWGMGTHLGVLESQNIKGEHMQEVTDLGLDYNADAQRGSMTAAKLRPHCDITDVVCLLCVRKSQSGGASTIRSSMSIYNEVFDNHPEYLDVLHRGFQFDLDGKGPTGAPLEVTHHIPVFSWHEGHLSCRFNQKAIEDGARKAGHTLSTLEQDAINYVGELAIRDDLEFAMDFQIGDVQILNNYVTLHSRDAFVDYEDPAKRRMLLRLWVNHEKVRPLNYDFANKALMGPRKGVRKRA
jgi:hypothetical protein